jgi:hypothetical protein
MMVQNGMLASAENLGSSRQDDHRTKDTFRPGMVGAAQRQGRVGLCDCPRKERLHPYIVLQANRPQHEAQKRTRQSDATRHSQNCKPELGTMPAFRREPAFHK